ncbi:NMT1/THI5 like domain protein [Cellulomonas flavigena DSM 20109]|uniref:Thiamine pyrimidine synthase n=1 Tax=Cellulomonas flavigena (strain ATCC 482 / DSM 20109 / BCRC 11376 / JCM 18109 / NBRC 3775 / NCIMB 8073 / NRS 134) TaxID=446466 RepID=D5UL19_CELFN|nr:ABC transporter substrate-binding protein [Cellulomonas flavigena]ADG75901.1 NMT1/THI5 like domain protein [Cellulomonas flavigena DSM 20109]
MPRTRPTLAVALLAAALAATACTGGTGTAAAGDLPVVRVALDWTPNTNHTGLEVALAKGWFADAGLDVQVLPYTDAQPDALVDAGAAEAGFSFHAASVVAQSAGADLVAVLAPLQHWATAVGVRADDPAITRPRDLDGRVYAGFGGPVEVPLLREVIRADGGTGDFTSVTLGTSAYAALHAGEADFTIPFVAWEGVEAERAGTPMRYFRYQDYGVPDAYSVLVDARRSWVEAEPDVAAAFVDALRRGYEYAADHPDEAAQILVDAHPDAFADPEMVVESQRLLAAEYLRADDGTVGTIDPERFAAFADFLLEHGLLSGPDGDPVTERPDWSTFHVDVTGATS